MKKGVLAALIVGLVVPLAGHAAKQCIDNKRIKAINNGYTGGSYGSDHGAAIYVTTEDDKTYPVNYRFNLNDNIGHGLHRVLLTAFVGQYPISAWDHYSDNCDDIDNIMINR